MGLTIKIQPKNVYGKTMYYPMCKNALSFCALLGTKTLTLENLRVIRELGFTHVIEAADIPELKGLW